MPRCVTHCPPERGGGPSLLAVAGVLAGVAAGAVILEFAESAAEAVALTVFAACAVCIAALVRNLWPAKRTNAPARRAVTRQLTKQVAALPALRLMLEQAQPVVYVITDAVREMMSR